MCNAKIAQWNATGRVLGPSYKVVDPLGYNLDKMSKAGGGEVMGASPAAVPDAQFDSPNAGRGKRGSNFTTGATSALLGG